MCTVQVKLAKLPENQSLFYHKIPYVNTLFQRDAYGKQRQIMIKLAIQMKYLSIFFTILFIWVAVILMALTRDNTSEIFQLYLAVMLSTVILFLIGFAKK